MAGSVGGANGGGLVDCGDTASFRTSCDRGTWTCTFDGTTQMPIDQCTF